MGLFKPETHKQTTQGLLSRLTNLRNRSGNALTGLTSRDVFSLESIHDADRRASVEAAVDSLRQIAVDALTENGEEISEYTDTQLDAALSAAAAADADGRDELLQVTQKTPVAEEATDVVISPVSINGEYGNVGRIKEALEAYDETENRNSMMLSFVYNLKASRQDPVGELFFPTVNVSPDTAALSITVDLMNVREDIFRKRDGSFDYQFNRKSLVNALVYPDILNNNSTVITPVYRDENDPEKINNKRFFCEDTTPWETTLDNGEVVKTNFLKVDTEMDLISLGNTEFLLSRGALDPTDELDTSVAISDLAIKLPGKAGTGKDVIHIGHLDVIPDAMFVASPNKNGRDMILNFESRFVKVDANTKKVDKSALTGPVVDNNYTVKLIVRATGNVNLETAVITVSAPKVVVNKIYDASGNEVDKEKEGKTTVEFFENAHVVGFVPKARRINSNRRERGQIIDINRERLVYALPIHGPVSVLRPTSDGDQKDSQRIQALVTATYARCSQAAIAKLFEVDQYLADYGEVHEPELLYNSYALGAARWFINPYHRAIDLDVKKELNTLKSSERMADVQAVMLNMIRELVNDAYMTSNYITASTMLNADGKDHKPLVIIATDPKIANYLQLIGDYRTLGNDFEMEVAVTNNIRMRGKMFISFGKKGNNTASDITNPLYFGNMIWRPELTSILPISRNGQISKELTVQPSFLHINHLPILMNVSVTNLPDSVSKNISLKTATV